MSTLKYTCWIGRTEWRAEAMRKKNGEDEKCGKCWEIFSHSRSSIFLWRHAFFTLCQLATLWKCFFLFVLGCCCRSQSVEIREKRTPKNILTILFFSLCHRPRWWHDRNDECFSVAHQNEKEANCAENGARGEDLSGMGRKKSHLIFIKKTSFSSSSLSLLAFFSHFTLQPTSARLHHDDDTMMNDVVDVRQWSVQKKSQQLLCCHFIFQHFEIVGCRHFVTMVSR